MCFNPARHPGDRLLSRSPLQSQAGARERARLRAIWHLLRHHREEGIPLTVKYRLVVHPGEYETADEVAKLSEAFLKENP